MTDHLRALGCLDERKIMMAHQTLIELHEVDHLQNLVCNYSSDLDIIYITECMGNFVNIYLPVHSSFILTPSWIRTIQENLSAAKPESIVLVIREGDSTFVRYKLTAGLIPSKVSCKKTLNVSTGEKSIDETDIKRKKLGEQKGEMCPESGCLKDE